MRLSSSLLSRWGLRRDPTPLQLILNHFGEQNCPKRCPHHINIYIHVYTFLLTILHHFFSLYLISFGFLVSFFLLLPSDVLYPAGISTERWDMFLSILDQLLFLTAFIHKSSVVNPCKSRLRGWLHNGRYFGQCTVVLIRRARSMVKVAHHLNPEGRAPG